MSKKRVNWDDTCVLASQRRNGHVAWAVLVSHSNKPVPRPDRLDALASAPKEDPNHASWKQRAEEDAGVRLLRKTCVGAPCASCRPSPHHLHRSTARTGRRSTASPTSSVRQPAMEGAPRVVPAVAVPAFEAPPAQAGASAIAAPAGPWPCRRQRQRPCPWRRRHRPRNNRTGRVMRDLACLVWTRTWLPRPFEGFDSGENSPRHEELQELRAPASRYVGTGRR